MKRNERFQMALSGREKALLRAMAEAERIPAAAVVRRALWREAQRLGLDPDTHAVVGIARQVQEAYNGE